MKESALNVLRSCALFRACDETRIAELAKQSGAVCQCFSAGDRFFTGEKSARKIGILLEGALTVYAHGEESTPLNRLKPGDLFGVSAFFGSPGADTCIYAEDSGELLFISEEHAEALWEDRTVRSNLISFLTNRICFLNRKIAAFTAKGAEGKLMRHLSQQADADGLYRVESSFSELAKELHLGRASLYRAMDKLEEEGIIQREKKAIRLRCPEAV